MTSGNHKGWIRKRSGNLSGYIAFALTALAMIPVSAWFLSLFGDFSFLAEMAVNFRLQILAIMLPFPLLIALTRRYYVAGALMLVTIVCSIPVVTSWIPARQPSPGENTIRLMTFNVLAPNQKFDEVIAQIRQVNPDIFVIAELSDAWKTHFEKVSGTYPWNAVEPRWHGYGIGIYSKFPMTSQETIQLTEHLADVPAIDATINAHGTPLRVVAVHFTSPISPQRLPMRNLQMKEIGEHAVPNGTATLMAGDFNCTPFSNTFGRLCKTTGTRDSRRGFGYQGSFPASPLILRIPIDHVLVSPEIHVSSRVIGAASGSDHLPVIIDFSISKPGQK